MKHLVIGQRQKAPNFSALKVSPYIIHSADLILFQSFEIRGYILNNQIILVGLDSCSRSSFFNPFGPF